MRTSDWGKNSKVLIVSNLNEADAPAGLRSQGIENVVNISTVHYIWTKINAKGSETLKCKKEA